MLSIPDCNPTRLDCADRPQIDHKLRMRNEHESLPNFSLRQPFWHGEQSGTTSARFVVQNNAIRRKVATIEMVRTSLYLPLSRVVGLTRSGHYATGIA